MWNLKYDTDIRLPSRQGGMEWEFGLADVSFLYIGWGNNKVLLYSTENYIQYSMINHNEK